MIPNNTWRRRFSEVDPHSSVHNFTRPSLYEILHLLPIAYRVSSYISTERNNKREPIFDMSGIALEPPKPGPHGGVPLGGLGSGSIGKGFRGEFRRWSLIPGRYVHRIVYADVFSLRIKRGDELYATVLAFHKPTQEASNNSYITSTLTSWNWDMSDSCGTYYGLHPRSWTVYENPVPHTVVIVKQVSPFLPHNYSDSSLPCACFIVEVINTHTTLGMEASVMFSFENSDIICDQHSKDNSQCFQIHTKYDTIGSQSSSAPTHDEFSIKGICMANVYFNNSIDNADDDNELQHAATSYSIASTNNAMKDLKSWIDINVNDHDRNPISLDKRDNVSTTCNIDQTTTSTTTTNNNNNHHQHQYIKEGKITTCAKFITGYQSSFTNVFTDLLSNCTTDSHSYQYSDYSASARKLWECFTNSGDIQDVMDTSNSSTSSSYHKTKTQSQYSNNDCIAASGSAICLKKWIEPISSEENFSLQDYLFINKNKLLCSNSKIFPFSLSWDSPIINFPGSFESPAPRLPRYYTQFFDVTGLSSAKISSFALLNINNWDYCIDKWQNEILSMNRLDDVRILSSQSLLSPISIDTQQVLIDHNESYYDHQLFNELYYLVDGGTIWCNSKQGKPSSGCKHSSSINGNIKNISELETCIQSCMRLLTISGLVDIHEKMLKHNQQCIESNGDQDLLGQFLYLEGHEYLMYNTYDVHFYASFALLMLWPQLELSLQRDFAVSILQEDNTKRTMMGSGDLVARKVKGYVPHDLGSPSEYPWIKSNAYNFQDVSRWKDLGPKFILQIYRNYDYLISNTTNHESKLRFKLQEYMNEVYPTLLIVMKSTEAFDLDGDGMIENQGFPDQTYDVWVATGVSAYCGGLWIASCEAMSKIAKIQKDSMHCLYYKTLAERAKKVYIDKLWNGSYLDYDSSNSAHHNSIMADMMAGQWYSHVCRLPAILSPERSFSCYEMIFKYNVKEYGKGQWIGAVNGMRPSTTTTTTKNNSSTQGACCIDNTCIQSREVWTGTTYALAAAMLHESSSYHYSQPNVTTTTMEDHTTSNLTTTEENHASNDHTHQHQQSYLTASQRQQLQHMSNLTAKGIHDGGWQRFGYWFATPEAWEQNGNYRSLGYMRPLCIWAMQFAKQQSVSKPK